MATQQPVECLETRILPAIAGFSIASNPSDTFERFQVTFSWNDDAVSSDTSYEVWVDQAVASGARISRILYTDDIGAGANTTDFQAQQDFDPGNYIAWVRKHDPTPTGPWVRLAFEVDDDGNPATPLPSIAPPSRPGISVIRQGQGAPGQTLTESKVGWRGEELLYDVWLNKRNEAGAWEPYSLVRNVPSRSISYRHLSAAANGNQFSYFGQIDQDGLQQLETGDYRIFVRGVNAATDQNGNWVGRGPWSAGGDFSFHRIEGAEAAPHNLTVTSELRPRVSWDAVEGAEAYTLSFWKGPDYANHPQIYLRINGTSYTPSETVLQDQNNSVVIEPGDEFFIKVRAIGQDGSHVGFETGNFASATVAIPQSVPPINLPAPNITGPDRITSDTTPILRWDDIGNADTYDVWLTSLQSGRRLFLATEVKQNALHVVPDLLAEHVSENIDSTQYSTESGLVEGDYRFWVRARNPASTSASRWSEGYRFTVNDSGIATLDLNASTDRIGQPIVSPNLILPYDDAGRRFLLVTNGRGETFGSSVLARYELQTDGTPVRPIVQNAGGKTVLEFPDIAVGSNVFAFRFLSGDRAVVLSRGTGELHLIDVKSWQLKASFSLQDDGGEFDDAINLEVLDNDQILVVFNRRERLRIFEIADGSSIITEVDVRTQGNAEHGFPLPQGRGVQLSGVVQPDGTFRIFMATPNIHAITIHDYDPTHKTLQPVRDDNKSPIAISRSQFSNPFHGGAIRTLSSAVHGNQSFYFSADRNGFLTWINTESLDFGFIDLADALPDVSRNPRDSGFASPNDNTFDSTRVLGVDDDQIAVLNNRQSSVLLRLVLNSDGRLAIDEASAIPPAIGGVTVNVESGTKLIGTMVGAFSQSMQSSGLVVNHLSPNAVTGTLESTGFTEVVTAVPIVGAVAIGDDIVVEYAGGGRSVIQSNQNGTELNKIELPNSFQDLEGVTYTLSGGVTLSYQDVLNSRSFLFVTAWSGESQSDPITGRIIVRPDRHLLVLDVADFNHIRLHHQYNINPLARLRTGTVAANEIVLLDRYGGEMLTITNWQNADIATSHIYAFHTERISELGKIRPARAVILPDGTRVTMHDTTPDRGVSVFAPGTAANLEQLVEFHAHNTGSFALDMKLYDEDRIITVNYSGDLVIQNVRNGVIEIDQNLSDFDGVSVNVAAAESIAYDHGVLVVNTPSTQTVAVYDVSHVGTSAPASPTRIFQLPEVVTTIVDSSRLWIVESGSVHRIQY